MESIQNFFVNLWTKFRGWIEANPRRAALWAVAIILFIIGFYIPVPTPVAELSGKPIFSNGPAWLTNTIVTTLIVDLFLIIISVLATSRMSLVPTGLQNLMEMLIEALQGLAESVAGDRARQFFPWVATIFLFVLISNWVEVLPFVGSVGFYHHETAATESAHQTTNFGARLALANGKLVLLRSSTDSSAISSELAPLAQTESSSGESANKENEAEFVPLFRPPSSDLNVTFALAITTMVMVQVWGIRTLGREYFAKFTNTKGPNVGMRLIAGFVSFLEILSEFTRVIAFGFRLFGNIFAGDVVLVTMAFLVPFFLPVPFFLMETFVGVIQAFVFMMLALVFFTMATISHGHEEHKDDLGAHGHHVQSEEDVDNVVPGTLAPEGSH